ncbi:MAG: ATP-binding protein [Leptolyngbyaceae cyanobacterium RU_5_1]|nr:ATP-binding protein [Leptolyngbyaceae cyanobacterium RU_5_1]
MNTSDAQNWQVANQHYLAVALEGIRAALQRYIAEAQGDEPVSTSQNSISEKLQVIAAAMPVPPALHTVCTAFALTLFERDLLLLCAGVELSASLAQLCATAQGSSQLAYPTFSLALAALPDAHWSALTPVRPLRHWRLIEVSNGESLTQSRLRVDERVLHYLNGISYLDDRLQGLIAPVTTVSELAASHCHLAERIISIWSSQEGSSGYLAIQLCGDTAESKTAIALSACAALGIQLHTLRAIDLPATVAEREALARLWEREAILTNSALLLECEQLDEMGNETMRQEKRMQTILPFVEALRSYLIVTTHDPLQFCQRPSLRLEVNQLSTDEQRSLWQRSLQTLEINLNGKLEALISQFSLSSQTIQETCLDFKINCENKSDLPTFDVLWETCRSQTRTRMEDLAQRISPMATWDDLVLPEPQRQTLREMTAQVRQRSTVYETWEFARRGANGLGISALFVGESGTGKTMAAEVVAHELQLDLYRIDLSQIVSKYIGETEKNLRRVFAAAETGGAILLFDEADALFGRRSEVKDSHDRYANIEVSYLLQRMEAYRGLAILTTNLKSAIDPAFLRRLRFVVQFPFPDATQRLEIWRRMFPPKLPTQGLDLTKLARLNVPGGNIRNIALNAAFLAADAGEPVQMKHLLQAAQSEYTKLEKSLTSTEVGGWI